MSELIALAKTSPGALAYASQGVGSNGHLTGELFKMRAGVDLLHVPYKGSAPALNDLLGAQVAVMFDNLPSVLPQIRAGNLRALAVTTKERSELLPETPSLDESGLPGFETSAWFAVLVSKATPEYLRERLERDVVAVLAAPPTRGRLEALGVKVTAEGSKALAQRIAEETQVWKEVVSLLRLRLE